MDRIEAAIVGAGVVGLAVARALAMNGRSVVILEREGQFGTGISSRNSEVIHAGLYYPRGSLKQIFCVKGREELYAYCIRHQVPHRRCGKLIFAVDTGELAQLEAITASAAEAGVDDLAWLTGEDVARLEPALVCKAALLSPSTGIVDSHAMMLSLLGEAEDHGAMLARASPVTRIEQAAGGWRIHAAGTILDCPVVVNSAGLGAQAVAAMVDALDPATIPPIYYAKGNYFAYDGPTPFSHLIYPVPVPGGLGTHLTLDLAGRARFGPDIEWLEAPDYAVAPERKAGFLAAARRIWPEIDPERLHPGYAGIRPKLAPAGEPPADFVIQCAQSHGLPGLVNLYGIESPGLTSCLALADEVLVRLA